MTDVHPDAAVRLGSRPVVTADEDFLQMLAVTSDPAWIRVCETGTPTPRTFHQLVWDGVTSARLLLADDRPVGFAAVYDVNPLARSSWVEAVVDPGYRADAAEALEERAFDHILHHALDELGYERAYVAAVVWRLPRLSERWAVERVARRVDYIFHEGTYWDHVVDVVTRRSENG